MYDVKEAGERAKAFRPQEQDYKSKLSMADARSTNADDYKAWNAQKPVIAKPPTNYQVTLQLLISIQRKDLQPNRPAKRNSFQRNSKDRNQSDLHQPELGYDPGSSTLPALTNLILQKK
ncbi:unnamed protein product, partial [Anisakis simplex]|uniref:Uncharacterized protein n=1 Tax=Anisakis simplex TaxID=6269 RepID=A0A0M3KGU7_ANISI